MPTTEATRLATYTKLTVDYYFIAPTLHAATLYLLDNGALGIDTDYKYALRVTLPAPRPIGSIRRADLPRYRVYRLRNPTVRREMLAALR